MGENLSERIATLEAENEQLRMKLSEAEERAAASWRGAREARAAADLWHMFIADGAPGMLPKLWEMVKRWRRTATDRQYMMNAYRLMLGPKGLEVAAMWDAKNVHRTHTSWGPKAAEMTGEERAQVLLDVEAAPRRLVDRFDDPPIGSKAPSPLGTNKRNGSGE